MEFLVFSSFPPQIFHLNWLDNIFVLGIEGKKMVEILNPATEREKFFPFANLSVKFKHFRTIEP